MTEDWKNRNDGSYDDSAGWRQERVFNGLSRYLDMEDEDYIEVMTDGNGKEEELDGQDQADWAMKWISEDLTELYEEKDEIWVMIYQDDSLEPVMHIPAAEEDEENIFVSPDYDPDFDSSIEIDGEEYDLSPVPILEDSEYAMKLVGRDIVVDDIFNEPELDNREKLDEVSDHFLQGKFAAPGLEDKYYEKAQEAIKRFINRNRSEQTEE